MSQITTCVGFFEPKCAHALAQCNLADGHHLRQIDLGSPIDQLQFEQTFSCVVNRVSILEFKSLGRVSSLKRQPKNCGSSFQITQRLSVGMIVLRLQSAAV
ncbi:protein of unknown function [Paraburkholderia dioscoreae]|uniref:Uncharacterized protein n=1 Tax=Paraburkholderia dioscoreae TaxID=2604047 RepID=A0A5Q4Z2Y4_9BURK|nr:protein of unknown function [Paraburkholderia dioscoreae]